MNKLCIPLSLLLFLSVPSGSLWAEEALIDQAYDYCKGYTEEGITGLTPYKPAYIIWQGGSPDPTDGERSYLKFQFSLKQHMCKNLYFSYTQKSFWSISRDSTPFKDSNYDPELFWAFRGDDGSMFKPGQIGFEHESNGREGIYSRSWNRAYWEPKFVYGDVVVSIKGWYPIKGWSSKGWKQNSDLSDNPDIEDYYGHGEVAAKVSRGHWQFGARGRKGNKGSYGSIQGDVLYKLRKNLSVYAQFWDGYGESLLDYNKSSTRYGIGLAFTDLLP